MMPATMEANSKIMIFDESQSKYKCCCGCMTVRTGAAVIATLKMFGVLMAILELFTGPHFFAGIPNNDDQQQEIITYSKTTTTTTTTTFADPFLEPISDDTAALTVSTSSNGNNNDFGAVRFASTAVYLLVEAVAVSCLFYALRRERPKFVVPEMALILVCMSLEMVVALLVIVAASFGSESLVQLVINRMRAQGADVTGDDIDQIRRLVPFVLTAFAFALIIGAAVEFWFFRVLKAYYRYLRDKMAFRSFNGDVVDIQNHHHCYANGYQPMMEESVGDEMRTGRQPQQQQKKDMPPAYQEIIQQQEPTAQQQQPPSYKEFAHDVESAAGHK